MTLPFPNVKQLDRQVKVLIITQFQFLKCSLVADKRLRSGLKAQQAHSPGRCPGLCARCPFGACLERLRLFSIQLEKLELTNKATLSIHQTM